ncbi:MAG: hypothetical protein JRI37_11865 [Deltaproteobacteria bacterium]|nr:hypothetical protein [Deltaproteobacteria bacterium]
MMRSESSRISMPWSPDLINNLKLKGCGLINCRSRLGARNSVREEIQQILMDRSGGDSRPDPEPKSIEN